MIDKKSPCFHSVMIDRRVSAAVSEVSDCATSPLVDNILAIVVASDFVRVTMWTPPFCVDPDI